MFTNTSDRILKQLGAELVLIRKACQDLYTYSSFTITKLYIFAVSDKHCIIEHSVKYVNL